MTAGRCKRRKTSSWGGDPGSGASENLSSPSRTSADEPLTAVRPAALGVDLYAQARKALTERCPFDVDETVPRAGTLPSVLAAILQRQSDGRRKHRKVQEEASGPGRPPADFSFWEKTEEYFRPVTLDDIDLLVRKVPPDSCFYLPGAESLPEEVKKDEAVLRENPQGEMDVTMSSAVFKKETDNVEMKAAPATTETDSDVTCTTTALPVEEPEMRDANSLNWILGCKQRFLLTSERPSKKRKHLAGDAGLEQLLLLPCTEDRAEALSPLCDVCCSTENDAKSNRLLFCDSCKVSVHQKCYGVMEMPTGAWLCSWCKQGRKSQRNGDDKESTLRPCLLCPKPGGALKPLAGNLECSAETNFVHLFCCLWTPEVYVDDVGVMEPIMKVGGVQETRRRLVCNLCKVKHGVCVRCSHGTCRTSLHPVCARAAKHQMEIWGKFGHDNVELRAFCLKHSSDGKIPSAEPPSKTSDDDFLVGKLSSDTVPIKRIPKIRITRKGKNKSMVGDGTASSVAGEVAKDDTDLDHESLVLKIIPECGDTKSCKMADMMVPDNDNDLPNAPEVIKIFRKIIDHRRINVGDVALELGVSSASLESAMTGEGTVFPLELRLKVIQWLKNIVHVQPSICHSKSRNGSTIPSGGLVARDAGRNDSCLLDMLPAVTDPLVVRSQPPCRIKNNKYNSGDDNVFSSTGKVSQSDCDMEFIVDVGGLHSDLRKDIVKDIINNVCPSHIEERHPEEHNVSEFREMFLANTRFPDSSLSGERLNKGKVPDNSEVNDMKEISVCSNLLVENAQIIEDDITELRRDSLLHSDGYACEARITKFKDVGSCSRSDIHPFILKKLNDLQNQWHLLHNPRNIEADCNDYGNNRIDTQPTTWMDECHISSITEQLAKANNVEILDLSSADEVEGELLSLQSWLLNRTISLKRSCEKVILSLVQQLPQELDVFRKNRWDMVHVNQYIIEVKEAKKRGRKDRKHKEVQAMLAAATAAATASRNSLPRKDLNSAVSLSFQQNPLKISSASGRTAGHSLPAPRLKETLSRSSIAKVSSDKHSGNFKLPDFEKDNTLFCDICWRSETIVNRIFVCSSCKVAVHLNCYRRLKDHPNGPWICELCEESSLSRTSPRNQQSDSSEMSFSRAQCSLCGGGTGAFRKLIGGEWVHAFCAEWVLESTYKRGQQNLVEGMDAFSKEKDSSTCYICHYRYGLCLKCSYGHCQTTFHPTCARSAGLFMNLRAIGGRFQHKAYCEKHSADQREKVDGQHGAEELKSIKHVRVELEKVRLLCERIIKREKIKRDLVVCSHGILASRRDCAAFSALFHGSFRRGISSESATTTIDNPSYSGTIQRSDDITVDSTASGRHSGRLLLDVDRKTDDSLTSHLSIKKKIPDRTKFSGKQLPQRPTAAPWNSANGGEKSSKDRKFL